MEPQLTLAIAAGAISALDEAEKIDGDRVAAVMQAYLPLAIRSWTFVERQADSERPTPVPVTREAMERLVPWDRGGLDLVQWCDRNYSSTLMRPLLDRLLKASQPTSTDNSMSATPSSGSSTPTPSAPSSPEAEAGTPSGDPVP